MPNEMYFPELLAMQLMFSFAVCIFMHYEMAVIAFEVVKYHRYFSFAWFYIGFPSGATFHA